MSNEARLRDQLDEANETIRQLREDLVPSKFLHHFPREWKLTPTLAKMLAFILARAPGMAHRDAILMNCIARQGSDDPPDIKIVDVQLCKLRKALKPAGIEIETLRGQGYALTPPSARLLKHICEVGAQGENASGVAQIIIRGPTDGEFYLEVTGEISTPTQLDEAIAALKAAAQRAWAMGAQSWATGSSIPCHRSWLI